MYFSVDLFPLFNCNPRILPSLLKFRFQIQDSDFNLSSNHFSNIGGNFHIINNLCLLTHRYLLQHWCVLTNLEAWVGYEPGVIAQVGSVVLHHAFCFCLTEMLVRRGETPSCQHHSRGFWGKKKSQQGTVRDANLSLELIWIRLDVKLIQWI